MNKSKKTIINIFKYCVSIILISIMVNNTEVYSQAKKIKFEEEVLDNGLTVIYNVDKSAPLVSTVLHYKVGSKDENPNRTGFAHFFEHLMFESTDHIPRATIDRYVNEAGGTLNAHTSFDETVYKFTLPSNELKLALWIESSRLRSLQVAAEGVETQRGVVKEERKVRYENAPYGSMLEKMMFNLFKGGSYSWTPIGSAEHIEKATVAEFKDFYDNFYQVNNGVLVISGDFAIADAKQYVKEYFGFHKKGAEPNRAPFKMDPLTTEYREDVPDDKAQLPGLFIGYRGAKIGEDDFYSLTLLTNILAAGESSRMYKKLVDEDKLAVQTALYPLALQNSGAVLFVGIPTPGKDVKELEKAIYEQIEEVMKNGVTDSELTKAKNIQEVESVTANKNTLSKAMSIARYKTYFGDANIINTEIDKYLAVTKEDIKKVAKKYFGTDKRVVLTYTPKSSN
jgi:predicted Zn-dependent peptidase